MHNLESEYILSRFKEPKLLSDSGKSQVYMVLDTTTSRPYIKKVFPKDTNLDIYQQMQSLEPKNIPKIHHVIEGETHSYVIEEYIPGTRLDEIIGNRGKIDESQVIDWVLSLCDTLKQIHDTNPPIIHRDIKPSNIIITDDNTPKLIDFNISRNYKSDGSTDTRALGTEYYAAPEQFGFAQTDKRTDIYAIGKLMITLSTGKQQKPEDGLAACGSLKSVIKKCCAIDSTRRYQDVSELRKALAQTKVNHFKQIARVIAVCIVIAVCYFGYQRLIPKDTPVNGANDSITTPDIGNELTQQEMTSEIATSPTAESTPEKSESKQTEPPAASVFSNNHIWVNDSEIFNSIIDDSQGILELIDDLNIKEDLQILLQDDYNYFWQCLENYKSDALYIDQVSNGRYIATIHPNGNGKMYFEFNNSGMFYVAMYKDGICYYYTNDETQTSILHHAWLYYWFAQYADKRIVLASDSASDTKIANSYRNLDVANMEDTSVSIFFSLTEEGALKFTVTVDGELYYGAADKIDNNIYSCFFDDTGYVYFHFIGDSLFVFEEQHVDFKTPTFLGNYKAQFE